MGYQDPACAKESSLMCACQSVWETIVATGDYRIESWQEEAASENSGTSSSHSEKARPDLTASSRSDRVLAATDCSSPPRQSDPAPQIGEAGIGADVVERRSNVEVNQQADAILISRFEELKGLVFLAQNATALR